MQLGAIILTGGKSQRMGRPKEALQFGDSTLLCHATEVLEHCCHPVIVVARDAEQELPPLPIETDVTYDDEADQGPLVGIASGMRRIADACDAAFVTPCDAPWVDDRAVAWLANQLGEYDLVMPRVEGKLQPLTAIYRTSTLATIDRLIAEGERRPRALTEHVRTLILDEAAVDAFDPSRRFLADVNTPEEYEALIKAAGDS